VANQYGAITTLMCEIRNYARETYAKDFRQVEIVDDGRPVSPIADGQFYLGIHTDIRMRRIAAEDFQDFMLTFKATVSWKTARTQRAAVGDLELLAARGFDWPIRLADMFAGRGSLVYLSRAHAKLGSNESLNPGHFAVLERCGNCQEQYGEWFGAGKDQRAATASTGTKVPQGLSITAEIGNIRYIRMP
jgi:hypothetical protein